MKIGILTLPFNNNYGGYLQCYALMTILKRMGHEPTLIMRRHLKPEVSIFFKAKYFLKGIAKTVIKRKYQSPIYDVENNYLQRGKEMLTFVNKYIQPQTIYIYKTSELKSYCYEKFEAYIVGSDQVWRTNYVPGIIGNMFLDFTDEWNVKRIAYAASFGTNKPEYTEREKQICGKLIEKFDAVSVRENSGLEVFRDFGWNVTNKQVVLDPTLLISKEDYNKHLPEENNQVKGKIFCYVLDKSNEAKQIISMVHNQISKNMYEITDIQRGNTVLPSIETWLTSIRDADFIITDSFHGTVFSIIFEKQFVVISNTSRGAARFEDFLGGLGLIDRIVKDVHSATGQINEIIDYTECRKKLDNNREKSLAFIKKNLL